MKINYLYKPIGMTTLISTVEQICDKKDAYCSCGLKPTDFFIVLDSGNGRTTFLKYLSYKYKQNNIRFFGGIDLYVEYTLDGSMMQIKSILGDIGTKSEYTNEPHLIIGFDITQLLYRMHEAQTNYFLDSILEISKSATIVFFVSTKAMKDAVRFFNEKIKKSLNNISYFELSNYTQEELADIAIRKIQESNIKICDKEKLKYSLINTINFKEVKKVKDVILLADKLILNANYSNKRKPFLSRETIDAFLNSYKKECTDYANSMVKS